MDLFEVLFIALFLLFPLLEGVLRKRRGGAPDQPEPTEREASGKGQATEARPAPGPDRGHGPASDMLPDDLWEVLTGERRERAPVAVEGPSDFEVEPWSTDPTWSPDYDQPLVEERTDWGRPQASPEAEEAEEIGGEPISLEYIGPEAYSLEQPLLPPEVRHARFHDRIEQGEISGDGRARPRRRSSLMRTLRSPAGVRDAVVLAEIFGRPKGLE